MPVAEPGRRVPQDAPARCPRRSPLTRAGSGRQWTALLPRGGRVPTDEASPPMPARRWAGFVTWLWLPAFGLTTLQLLLLFPDGHVPSPAWRPVAWATPILFGLASALLALTPGRLENFGIIDNPFGVAGMPGPQQPGAAIFL